MVHPRVTILAPMTTRGKVLLTIIILAVVGYGATKWWDRLKPGARSTTPNAATAVTPAAAAELVETQREVPALAPPGAYHSDDGVIAIELSEYAGYAGLIVANGGLEPNENSIFFKKHGLKVRLSLSEEESWSALNSGKLAASATTVDVLAIYGKQFQVVVPAQIGFSRGADGVVVRSDLNRINALKGRVLAASQFTEADFFIRYLAQEAGVPIQMLDNLGSTPDPGKLNLVYCEDAFAAGDLFLRSLTEGSSPLAGCVTWAPKTSEVVAQSGGKAHILTTNLNLLIIADILVVNRGFAQQQPKTVAGLVHGLIAGNDLVRRDPEAHLDIIARAFKWDRAKAKSELAKVHLSNLPENLAFFSGAIAAAGSFGGIYQAAVYAYGSELIKDPIDSERFVDLQHLKALEQTGEFKDQQVAIAPIRMSGTAAVEGDPVLSKDIRFLFGANSVQLDLGNEENKKNLEVIKQMLTVSPGSTVLLRGHVDRSKIEEFRKMGGEAYVRTMALRSVELSRNRAAEIKRLLVEQYGVSTERLNVVGRGWEEPVGPDPEQNRRVEVQWFMLE
jgi:NitT/TauT family transport system substrate-binding protein